MITDDKLKIIKKLTEDGLSAERIALNLSMKRDDVLNIIKENKFELEFKKFSELEYQNILSFYKNGISIKTLGKKYRINKSKIEKLIKDSGEKIRTFEEAKRIINFNENIFDEINTQENAYWLGFLYADGYNNEENGSLSIGLKRDDRNHIERFCDFINCPKSHIKDGSVFLKTTNKEYPTSSIKLYSNHLSLTLKDKGCPQAKSFIINFPTWLDEKLIPHFVRGYFDGDGSIKMNEKTKEWKINICGTDNFVSFIKKHTKEKLDINFSKTYHSETENNTWLINLSGNIQIEKFCEWLYNDKKPGYYLERKYNRYIELANRSNKLATTQIKKMNNEDKNNILNSYKDGKSLNSIIEDYNLGYKGLKKFLTTNDVDIRSADKSHRIYKMNSNLFIDFENEKSSYILGFLYGKGSNISENNSIRVNLTPTNIDIGIKIVKDIYPENYEIKNYKSENYFNINSKDICNALNNLGFKNNKEWPNIKMIEQHFIRGFIEARANLHISKNKSHGSLLRCRGDKGFMECLGNYLKSNIGLKFSLSQKENEKCLMSVSGNKQIKILFNYIYMGSGYHSDNWRDIYLKDFV